MADKKIEETIEKLDKIEDIKEIEEMKEIDSSNIFDEFVDDSNLIDEVNKIKKERNKDLFFYVSMFGDILQTVFWLGIIVLLVLLSYIYIQNNEELKNKNTLDPFCIIFLGDITNEDTYCSSISSLKMNYTNKLSNLEKKQATDILKILEELYKIENFTKSKDVLFLVDKTENKLKVLSILESFDDMKNEFNKVDKQKIQCKSIQIDGEKKILTMNCAAYSAGYEKGLRGFDGTTNDNLKGTSISIANSFLNYIEKQSTTFSIINKQKVFKSESVLGEKTDFTNRTQFNLVLKYNLK